MESQDLRRRRLHLGISREQLAHSVGVATDELSEWENGTQPIRTPIAVERVLRRFESPHDEQR